MISVTATETAIGVKRNLPRPSKNVTGKNTTISARLAISTGIVHFGRALIRRFVRRGAHFKVALDVLERDDCFVDQRSGDQRETAQGHEIERLIIIVKRDHAADDRQRDDQAGDDRRA